MLRGKRLGKTKEFDCCECGRHIIRFMVHDSEPTLCAECLFLPGWYRNEGLRNILDKNMELPSDKE